MSEKLNIWKILLFDTFGAITLASLLICSVSGIFLAIPFDVNDPYQSISLFLLNSPGATFFRNVHYWSAQFFLVFTIAHTWDHFYQSTEKKVKRGVWLRLTISIIVIFYVMISGFILKGDQDAIQARQILDSLIAGIPLIGNFLSYSLLGSPENYQLIYVHHIATATIFIFIISFEHVKTIWTKAKTVFITSILIIVLSFCFQAPLHDDFDPVVKGPWYFLGLQEILHYLSQPEYSLLGILFLLMLLYFIPWMNKLFSRITKWFLLAVFTAYLVFTILACCYRGENWKWEYTLNKSDFAFNPEVMKIPSFFPDSTINTMGLINGRYEGCIGCHYEMSGFSKSHDTRAIGCVSCHAGNPFTPDKNTAHRNMILIPGNLTDAKRSCGTTDCHPEITNRIDNTLMTTLSGMVSVDRFVFNEIHTLNQKSRITEIGYSPADKHLRDLCASCHLGNPKTDFGPIDQLSRGGGCNACHLNYDVHSLYELSQFDEQKHAPSDYEIKHHPNLSINISNEHCFGCHSRSGRISTNYEGWHETLLDEKDIKDSSAYRILDDHRVFRFIEADVHHQSGILCTDCHNSYELMGDGTFYLHEEEQVKIQCEDCHNNALKNTITINSFDAESRKIADLMGHNNTEREYLVIEKSGFPLINTFLDTNKQGWLISKGTSDTFLLNPPAQVCKRGKGHNSLTCKSCHSSWVPQCIGCHNQFEKNTKGFDLLANKAVTGEWVEFISKYLSDPPVLGVFSDTTFNPAKRKIETFAPSMILSIDIASFSEEYENKPEIFHRLFSPVSAHTTQKKGRSCKSCHNNPNRIGYGRGTLEYKISEGKGIWEFKPRFSSSHFDGRPADAWVGFLMEKFYNTATRYNHRPFTIEEQQKILTIGACLHCHEEGSDIMMQSLDNYQETMNRLSNKCILPEWP